MTNYVLCKKDGRVVGNTESEVFIESFGKNFVVVEHPPVEPSEHWLVDGEIIKRSGDDLSREARDAEYRKRWSEVRRRRDGLLAQSDYTQLPDSNRDREAWAEYRQALRDMTIGFADPAKVVWPKPPSN